MSVLLFMLKSLSVFFCLYILAHNLSNRYWPYMLFYFFFSSIQTECISANVNIVSKYDTWFVIFDIIWLPPSRMKLNRKSIKLTLTFRPVFTKESDTQNSYRNISHWTSQNICTLMTFIQTWFYIYSFDSVSAAWMWARCGSWMHQRFVAFINLLVFLFSAVPSG